MPTFEYQAVGADGQTTTGVLVGSSLDAAMAELRDKGMQVLRIGVTSNLHDPLAGVAVAPSRREMPGVETAPPPSDYLYDTPSPVTEHPSDERILEQRSYMATSVWGPMVGKVGLNHLAFFFRQLSTMLNAGVPFVQSLDTLSNQARDPKLKNILREFRTHVEAGRPMSTGMQRYPEVFSPVMLSLTRAGEQSGMLDESLGIVADYIDREIKLRNLYRRVTFYPKLQLVLSVVIILGANLIIGSINAKATKLYSPLTDIRTWFWLTPLIIIVFLFLRVGLANPRVKYNWDQFTSHIPYLGNTLRQLSMAKFGRAFGALYKGGVPITQAMQLSADASGNEYLRAKMYPAAKVLESGAGIGETFKSTRAFSPIVLDMVHTGETTGSLDQMLGKMSDFYEDEAETRSTQLAYVSGAVIGLVVMIYIGYVIISFYTGFGEERTRMTE